MLSSVSDKTCIESISSIQKGCKFLLHLTSGFLFVHFCEVAKLRNHPQEDLAKIGYKRILFMYILSTCCQMRHSFLLFFPKIQKNGKNKEGQNCKFLFLFRGLSKTFTKKGQTIKYHFLRILPSSSDQ